MATKDSHSCSVQHVEVGRTAHGIRVYGTWHTSVRHVVYDSKKGGLTETLNICYMNHRHLACHAGADATRLIHLHDIF